MTKISKLQLALGDLFISDPEKELGPNWETVLNFWLFLDSLSSDQHKLIGERFNELNKCGHFIEYCVILCQYARRVLGKKKDCGLMCIVIVVLNLERQLLGQLMS